ncbi:TIR domain-containing protein [Campylobacter lari]|nr:TIR domain-containing protein [Campylobacter lari]EAK0794637.1 TIR domain-containing protein [Campylobacter lari]EAK9875842.1 TIR domain-containing protein [Campylobacter lari]MCV3394768.1 TIR domain-containing protein [Campylobacter lari]MCV3413447.1 TIR domain-containing protein [Campylobacter lari]
MYYYVFISHSWTYDNEYSRVVELLDQSNLKWRDYSIPKNDPIHTTGSDKELEQAIEKKIKCCSCVIVLAGVYSTYSKWINKEVQIAKRLNKKVIAIEKWGSERTSKFVKEHADKIIKWQSGSLANAIIN